MAMQDMLRGNVVTSSKFAKRLLIGAAMFMAALIIYGLAEANTMKLRLFKEKNGTVIVELIHKPNNENRWIVLIAENSSITIPYSTSSTSQSNGEKCPVIHRWRWRDVPPVGVLTVEAKLVNGNGKQLEWAQAKIIMGPEAQ